MKTTIFIGRFNELNIYRLQKLREEYSPFIKTFNSINAFVSWQKGINTQPLLRERYLAILEAKYNYRQVESLLKTILENQNKYVHLAVLIEPREKFHSFPDVGMEVVVLNKYIREDFEKMVREELPNITQKGMNSLIKRIGYSINTFQMYKDELAEFDELTDVIVRKVIKEARLRPIEWILLGIIKRDKGMIVQHYKLAEKYSENWVIRQYISMLDNIIKLKSDLRKGNTTFVNIRNSDYNKNYVRLVKDTTILEVFTLKIYLEKYKNLGIEMYLRSGGIAADRFNFLARGKNNV